MRNHRRLLRRHAAVIGAAFAVLVVLCSVALLVFSLVARESNHSETATSGSTAPPAGTAAFDRTRAGQINDALAARERTRFHDAVAVLARSPISDSAVAAVAEAAPLDFDLSTVRYNGADTATVTARAAHEPQVMWRIYLILDNNVWKIAATEKQMP